jgi:Protein of unknown function (DUF5674)
MHADEEQFLLEHGSKQENLWGINIFTEGPDIMEFDALINIRPGASNRSRDVEDVAIRGRKLQL